MQELGLHTLSYDLKQALPQTSSTDGKKSANKITHSSDSESSEYLLDDDEQGDSDDDDDVLQPLPVKHPRKGTKTTNMAPGMRPSKRVRVGEQPEVQPFQTQTRSSKRLHTTQTDGNNVEEPTDAHDDILGSSTTPGLNDHDRTDSEAHMASVAHDNTCADEGNLAIVEETEAPAQRRTRRPRAPTKGKQLDRMTKAMGRRLPIVVEGNRRPHEPIQAAKFASEAGVVIRESITILPHWKEYKKDEKYYKTFVGQLSGRLAIKADDKPTEEACTDMMRSAVKNQRYRLKQRHFNGVPANEISRTSPVPNMTDAQWRALVAKWSDPKNMETCEKNKLNRSKVKYHQATGSRSYVAHLHAYKQKRNREQPRADQTEELDAVEVFKTCHTSSKTGLSDPAREALSDMDNLRAQPVAEGEKPPSSVEVVSKVLPNNSCNQFLKSAGIKTPASSKSSSSNESELREQLATEAAAAYQDELEKLNKKSEEAEEKLERTQNELEEYKKMTEKNMKEMEENNVLLRKLLSYYGNGSSST